MMKESESLSINIKNLNKSYSRDKGIFDINIKIESGQLNLITGKNGSGKSTLLKCIMKLVSYHGKIEKRRWRIGYAPEEYVMPDFMTVNEFLYSMGRIKGLDRYSYKEYSADFYKIFNIEKYQNKTIKSLSNGTKQKINLIQALIHEPRILIFDEPLVALDYSTQDWLIKYLTELSKTKLIIISTHRPEKFNSRNKKTYIIADGRIND